MALALGRGSQWEHGAPRLTGVLAELWASGGGARMRPQRWPVVTLIDFFILWYCVNGLKREPVY